MKIAKLLMRDMVLLDLKCREREDALREMVAFLKSKNRISREKELYERLLQRERLGSTAIGEGVAIPHCKLKGVKDPLVMLAISREGVDFESRDGQPSHLFFLVVSSPDKPSLNLQILAAIAHLVRKAEALIKRVLSAGSIDVVLDIIVDEEAKLD